MSKMFLLIKWKNHHSRTVLEETPEMKDKEVGDSVVVSYGRKKFEGNIIIRSENKVYLDSLDVDENGYIIKKSQKSKITRRKRSDIKNEENKIKAAKTKSRDNIVSKIKNLPAIFEENSANNEESPSGSGEKNSQPFKPKIDSSQISNLELNDKEESSSGSGEKNSQPFQPKIDSLRISNLELTDNEKSKSNSREKNSEPAQNHHESIHVKSSNIMNEHKDPEDEEELVNKTNKLLRTKMRNSTEKMFQKQFSKLIEKDKVEKPTKSLIKKGNNKLKITKTEVISQKISILPSHSEEMVIEADVDKFGPMLKTEGIRKRSLSEKDHDQDSAKKIRVDMSGTTSSAISGTLIKIIILKVNKLKFKYSSIVSLNC
ncbi:uncharacterized protein LOC127287985 isoform X3 [Leptopilina boulardi]|uniref:uncharacterized protein LOC127279041 isoform X2 n=1 Tax=Leptopilina boulardi TaxID=63433 RepID=UPI0021F67F3E|nr:uncharacterized protein LOC127279041 isoform X2 [Leptopilina boulardi]XP_051157098.1 uncharacterized protein LOC127279041 isoform X3 [Leptopilina boulardi]XP_051159100.1 uncharacterized protein LOC127280257 isoform X2 [Leptopilina boulardi]XP_051159101.1 uncharacterized protein LOC127280257 isoform X3 [Leptopilina boulardi]XP_051171111.1 uncharacterized protein LOC127287985 isoform X2 [Leptopilina boulardi]XP_051171112.1 uncharacterized protein LOC127287985 isoform X3 [Leptopilina boulardi]